MLEVIFAQGSPPMRYSASKGQVAFASADLRAKAPNSANNTLPFEKRRLARVVLRHATPGNGTPPVPACYDHCGGDAVVLWAGYEFPPK